MFIYQLQSDEESRRELSHLGHFVETCLRSPEVLQHEDNVKQEAKTRFNTVRERMMRTSLTATTALEGVSLVVTKGLEVILRVSVSYSYR